MKGWTLAFGALGIISIATFALTDKPLVRIINVVLLGICVAAVIWLQRKKQTK